MRPRTSEEISGPTIETQRRREKTGNPEGQAQNTGDSFPVQPVRSAAVAASFLSPVVRPGRPGPDFIDFEITQPDRGDFANGHSWISAGLEEGLAAAVQVSVDKPASNGKAREESGREDDNVEDGSLCGCKVHLLRHLRIYRREWPTTFRAKKGGLGFRKHGGV